MLDTRGFMVVVVNAHHVMNVSGCKSDVPDCQWLKQLMSYGLLRGASHRADGVHALRALSRRREMLLRPRAPRQQMQKSLTQMNLQLANVLSDVMGETGRKIQRAIVVGERDGAVLASLKNAHIHANSGEVTKSTQGDWRGEHLFSLEACDGAARYRGRSATAKPARA